MSRSGLLWQSAPIWRPDSSPRTSDLVLIDDVLIAGELEELRAINPLDGTTLWSRPPSFAPGTALRVGRNSAVTWSEERGIEVVNTTDGGSHSVECGGVRAAPVASSADTLLVSERNLGPLVLCTRDRSPDWLEAWRFDFWSNGVEKLGADGTMRGRKIAVQAVISRPDHHGKKYKPPLGIAVMAFTVEDPQPRWIRRTADAVAGRIVLLDDLVISSHVTFPKSIEPAPRTVVTATRFDDGEVAWERTWDGAALLDALPQHLGIAVRDEFFVLRPTDGSIELRIRAGGRGPSSSVRGKSRASE